MFEIAGFALFSAKAQHNLPAERRFCWDLGVQLIFFFFWELLCGSDYSAKHTVLLLKI